jgi:5-methylcytosine-specific restriction endonuclease McrA
MPIKKKYEAIRLNPERWEKYKKEKREWFRKDRIKHPFKWLCKYEKKRNDITIQPFDLWKLAKKQKLVCAISGRRLTAENLSIDHIIPMVNGGSTEIHNMQLVDYYANLAKFTLTMDELYSLCEDILNYKKLNGLKKMNT